MSQERRQFIPRDEGDTQMTEAEIQAAQSGSAVKKTLRTAVAAGGAMLMAENAVAQQPKKESPKAEKSESKSGKITDSIIEKIPAEQKQKLDSLKAELKELENSSFNSRESIRESITVFLYRNRLFAETPEGRVELERRMKESVNYKETQKVAEFLDEVYRSLGGLEDQIKNASEYTSLPPRQQYKGNVLTTRTFSGPRLEKDGITISEAIKLYYEDLARLHDEFKKLAVQIDVTDAAKRIR